VRWLLVVTLVGFLVCGCSVQRATMVRNLGIGVTAEGALLTGGAFVTRDSDEGISDAVVYAAPLLATGIVAWIAGEILIGMAGHPKPPVSASAASGPAHALR
jgi:hypothetical protein